MGARKATMFNRKHIEFVCTSGIPYERIQYLESLGVKVWPGSVREEKETGGITAAIAVNAAQHAYAAGLLQGVADTCVLDPYPVAPIQPRTRWGVAGKRAQGPAATALRAVAGLLGVQAKTPPVAPRPARPQKTTTAKPVAPAKRRKPTKSIKRKSAKPSAIKQLWDSLSDE